MRSVRVLEAAATEATEAAGWYEARRKGLGAGLRSEFKLALDRLREGMLSGRPWPGPLGERGVKRLLMNRFPFSVVFVDYERQRRCAGSRTPPEKARLLERSDCRCGSRGRMKRRRWDPECTLGGHFGGCGGDWMGLEGLVDSRKPVS